MAQDITAKIEAHFASYPLRKYPKGQILIHGGDDPQHIFYLTKGKVRQYDISYRGDEVVMNVYKPGAFFPMLWALTGLPNRHFFSAENDVEVRVAPKDETLEFLKANQDVTLDLLTRLYIGVDGLLGRMAHLMAGSARSRLLYELIIECKRFNEQTEGDVRTVAVSEGDLAARAGLSRETVSREMQKLIKQGLVDIKTQKIIVHDLKKLEEKLGSEL
jgi:CRP-like cAMP-binding protein